MNTVIIIIHFSEEFQFLQNFLIFPDFPNFDHISRSGNQISEQLHAYPIISLIGAAPI